jgi:hypothetical protein
MNFDFNQTNTIQQPQSPLGSPNSKRRKFKRVERSSQFDDPDDRERVRKELELKKELHRLQECGLTGSAEFNKVKDEINKLRLISMNKADERAKEEEEEGSSGMMTSDD